MRLIRLLLISLGVAILVGTLFHRSAIYFGIGTVVLALGVLLFRSETHGEASLPSSEYWH